MLGIVHRAAIKLAPAGDELLIAEGLETAMSPREAGLSTPCWALGSVGAISFFPIIDGVQKLKIAAEPGEASERAITMCRRRWRAAGRRVITVRSISGGDLNDAIRLRTAGGTR
jgi:putative DNA primase/helicase